MKVAVIKICLATTSFALASTGFAQSAAEGIPAPHQIQFSGYFFKYPKGASQATIERYIPEIRCQEYAGSVMCSSPTNELSSMFIRGVQCLPTSEVMFILANGKVVGAGCEVALDAYRTLAQKYAEKYGPAKFEKSTVSSLTSRRQTWKIGSDEQIVFSHWAGADLQGKGVNKFSIRVSPISP